MPLIKTLEVELIEKEIVEVDLIVVDFIPKRKNLTDLEDVTITDTESGQTLIYRNGTWVNEDQVIELNLQIYNEVPTRLTSKRFRISNSMETETLRVYFNGLKEKGIIIHSSTEFSLPIDSIIDDKIEVNYTKQ